MLPTGRFWPVLFCVVALFPYNEPFTQQDTRMATPPKINLTNSTDYRENYANSVQVRWSVWDFFLAFGTFQQQTEDAVDIKNFQGVYLSPQQAKALKMILEQNVSNYEATFGEIKLDPRMAMPGAVN
jgi:hypothetical protein